MSKTPELILIAGTSYSGSTVLDRLLTSVSDDVVSTGEIYALARPTRKHHAGPRCSCGEVCPKWRQLNGVSEQNYHNTLRAWSSRSVVVDSSKDLAWIADAVRWSTDLLPAAVPYLALLYKSPAEFVLSADKRGFSAQVALRVWCNYYSTVLDTFSVSMVVPYRDFVLDPHGFARRILRDRYVGRDVFEESHHLYGSRWFNAGPAAQSVVDMTEPVSLGDLGGHNISPQSVAAANELAGRIRAIQDANFEPTYFVRSYRNRYWYLANRARQGVKTLRLRARGRRIGASAGTR